MESTDPGLNNDGTNYSREWAQKTQKIRNGCFFFFSVWIENIFLFLEGRNVGNYFQDKSVSKRVELFFEIHD